MTNHDDQSAWSGQRLDQLFERRVREAPDRIALTYGDEHVTYGQLDARASSLAGRLRSHGVGPDTLVALCAERGIEMIVGLVGILKAGGAYVPIDPAYPEKRLRFHLADCGAAVVVASGGVADALAAGPVPVLAVEGDDAAPGANGTGEPRASDQSLAYAIYTSGTTGVPKAVLVEHRQVVRLFTQTWPWYRFDDRDVWTLFHSISFDFSVWEVWGALLYGGRLVIVPGDVTRSPDLLHDLLVRERVTVLNQTPSAFRQLVAADARRPAPADLALRVVILGGERLEVAMLEPWIGRYGDQLPQLVNMYGITETTVFVTYRPIRAADLRRPELSPIGVPIPDLRAHVLDESRRPVADGEPGDLYVAGPGLARGYLGRPELTAERFIELPGIDQWESRLYVTGDRVARLPDGELTYLGRSDDQLKVRGFRVEPQEIQLCLAAHPRVETVEVVAEDFGDGDVRLVAYVLPRPDATAADGAGAAGDLVAALTDRAGAELPAHMRPSAYRLVREMPMTLQGKVDRAALRDAVAYEPGRDGAAEPAQAGLSATEGAVLRIVEEILERDDIESDDDVFDLGATSLALVRIIAGVNQEFGVSLTGAELEDTASVRTLAGAVESARAEQLVGSQEA